MNLAIGGIDATVLAAYLVGVVLFGVVIVALLGAGSTELSDVWGNLPRGWARLAEYAHRHGKFQLFDFSFDVTRPNTFWSGLLGGVFVAMATHGTDQLMVQRYLSAQSERAAGRALALSGFVVCGQFALFLLIGVGIAGQLLNRSVVESVMAIATFTIGVILGVFFLGVLTKRVTQRAALFGLIAGLAVMAAVVFNTHLAWPWFAVVGSSITFGAGCLAALFFPDENQDAPESQSSARSTAFCQRR